MEKMNLLWNRKMEIIRPFNKLSSADVDLAGGKGASLGEMTQAGIPVPPGFVVLTSAFEKFIEDTGLKTEIEAILDSVNHQEFHTVEEASERIRAFILMAKMPPKIAEEILSNFRQLEVKYVAVRSSATAEDSSTAAWAGQLESFLNTSEQDLLINVKNCWASLFTSRAIYYRFEKGLHLTKISVAVVVQAMIQAEVSGICFSVHPVTNDYNQLIIEAGFGLGEAIVGGMITPDTYVIQKNNLEIINIYISDQKTMIVKDDLGRNVEKAVDQEKQSAQKMLNAEIIKLAKICMEIEKHYGVPEDIEWALAGGQIYIVQSRPITTLRQA